MRFQLNGFVEVTYQVAGNDVIQALSFDADEFSGIDTRNGFSDASGEPIYRGLWDAVEESIQVRLVVVADRKGFREKTWEILPFGGALVDAKIDRDRITCEFVDDDKEP